MKEYILMKRTYTDEELANAMIEAYKLGRKVEGIIISPI